ncbi:hypothetical protein B6U70_02380 [Euryarchaeota archaeon ex4484_162]|nr:MAG: hypothetical protein B6U70_02380 [Euryarchaeota archaeon ex4484_162]
MGNMFVKKAVVIAIAAFFLLLSVSATVSSKGFILGALRLKIFLNKTMSVDRLRLLNITVEKIKINTTKGKDGYEGQIPNGEMRKIDDSIITPHPPKSGGEEILKNGEMIKVNGSFVNSSDSNSSITHAPTTNNNESDILASSGNMQQVNGSLITPQSPTSNNCMVTGGQECIVPPPFRIRLQEIYQKIIQRWRRTTNTLLPTITYLDL